MTDPKLIITFSEGEDPERYMVVALAESDDKD